MRRIDSIQYLRLGKQLNNPSVNRVELDTFRCEAAHNYFTMLFAKARVLNLKNEEGCSSDKSRYNFNGWKKISYKQH